MQAAREFLERKENKRQQANEELRTNLLNKVIHVLQEVFRNTEVSVYLVGSIVQPYRFSPRSDVDIVLKNFKGDRFELWAQLERQIDWSIEVILWERCTFQGHIEKQGYKVC